MKNKLDIWMISRISAFTGQQIDEQTDDSVAWYIPFKNEIGTVFLDFKKKELGFIDWIGDDKTYYSLVGVAMMGGWTTEDYYSEK